MDDRLEPAFHKACEELQRADPMVISFNSDVPYLETEVGGEFCIDYLRQTFLINYPYILIRDDIDNASPPSSTQLILLHYLLTADGFPITRKWIPFRELSGGMGYEKAFNERSISRLIRAFHNDRESFVRAGSLLGGEPSQVGDASVLLHALPRLPILIVLWLGGEGAEPTFNIIFDASANHYLPTEDLAILADIITDYLIKLAKVFVRII